jgi:hypothetical protein
MARASKLGRIRDWLVDAPLRTVRAGILAVAVALQEALSGSAAGIMATADAADIGWRPITERVAGKEYRRDLSPLSQEQMLRVAHYLYTGNALAQFLINVPVSMTIGRSLTYTLDFDYQALGISRLEAQDLVKKARRFLDPWWTHPAHDFKTRATRYARTYLVTGELLLVIPEEGINPTTGLFMLDYIDSQLISDVEGKGGLATTPGRVLVKSTAGAPVGFDVMLPTAEGVYEGQCFFFRHGGRLNSLRGMSDLLAQADWIDLHDQLLFGRVDKAILSNTLVHDLTIEGAQNDSELKAQTTKFLESAAKPGGVFAHNEKVKHEIKTADLKEADASHLVRTVLLHVLGSKGIPEHWFANADNTNRASSSEQSDTAYKLLEELQEELLQIFALPLNVAYDRLASKQSIFPGRDTGAVMLHPDLPKISEKDISRMGQVIAAVEAALDTAVASGRISRRTAQRVSLTLMEKITGEHVDQDDEAAQVEMEQEEIQRIEQERRNASARAALDLAKQIDGKDGTGGDPAPPPGRGAGGAGKLNESTQSLAERVAQLEEQDRTRQPIDLDVHVHQGDTRVEVPVDVGAPQLTGKVTLEAALPAATVEVHAVGEEAIEKVAAAAHLAGVAAAQVAGAASQIATATAGVSEAAGRIAEAAAAAPPTTVIVPAPIVHTDVHVPPGPPMPSILDVRITDQPDVEQKVERDADGNLTGTITTTKPKKE